MLNAVLIVALVIWTLACITYPIMRDNGMEENKFLDNLFGVSVNKKKKK